MVTQVYAWGASSSCGLCESTHTDIIAIIVASLYLPLFSYINKPYHLTFLLHPNHCWDWTWLTNSHCVVGPHPETVFPLWLQPGGHSVWSALTLSSEFTPVLRLRTSLALYLNHITQDSTATVVAGARPGQHKAAGRDEGDHRAGGRRLWPLWWEDDEYIAQTAILLYIVLTLQSVCCLTYDRKGQRVLCWAFTVLHYNSVATCVLWFSLFYNKCAALISIFCPQLWTIRYLQIKKCVRKRERGRLILKGPWRHEKSWVVRKWIFCILAFKLPDLCFWSNRTL